MVLAGTRNEKTRAGIVLFQAFTFLLWEAAFHQVVSFYTRQPDSGSVSHAIFLTESSAEESSVRTPDEDGVCPRCFHPIDIPLQFPKI
jgi:hypothetical protein